MLTLSLQKLVTPQDEPEGEILLVDHPLEVIEKPNKILLHAHNTVSKQASMIILVTGTCSNNVMMLNFQRQMSCWHTHQSQQLQRII